MARNIAVIYFQLYQYTPIYGSGGSVYYSLHSHNRSSLLTKWSHEPCLGLYHLLRSQSNDCCVNRVFYFLVVYSCCFYAPFLADCARQSALGYGWMFSERHYRRAPLSSCRTSKHEQSAACGDHGVPRHGLLSPLLTQNILLGQSYNISKSTTCSHYVSAVSVLSSTLFSAAHL